MINIKGNIDREKVRETIDLYFQDWSLEIEEEEEEAGRCDLYIRIKNDYIESDLYRVLADAIEEIIINNYLDRIIKNRVRRIYKGQYANLSKYVVNRIKEEIKTSDIYLDEKIKMKDELVDYLEENQAIDMDGYMVFRLNDYVYILDIAIDNIITEIKEEKRIKEFLDMVKYIIDSHPARENVINLILRDGDFILKDIDNNEVGSDIISKLEEEFDTKTVTKSDILLSSLIMISPKKLIVHSDIGEDAFLIKAIKEIFEDRAVICKGCKMCKLD